MWVRIPLRRGVLLDTTLCDKVCQWLSTGWWFSLCTLVSSTNKTDRHDITEILLKVALNTLTPIRWPHIASFHFKVQEFLSSKRTIFSYIYILFQSRLKVWNKKYNNCMNMWAFKSNRVILVFSFNEKNKYLFFCWYLINYMKIRLLIFASQEVHCTHCSCRWIFMVTWMQSAIAATNQNACYNNTCFLGKMLT